MRRGIKQYKIHLVLFAIAIVAYLSINQTLSGFDDYYYFFGAVDIVENHTYFVDGAPVQYPMGYSLLIVPFILLFGTAMNAGTYPAAIFGALTVVLLYEFTKIIIDKRTALFAALFLMFSNLWAMSTVIMADIPALFFMLLSIFAVAKFVKTEKPFFVYLFFFAAGLATLIRYTSALVFLVAGLYLLFTNRLPLLKKKHVWLGIPLFLVIVSPQLIYNSIHFGSPFRTGYYWQTGMFNLKQFFTSGDRRPPFQIINYLKYCVFGFGTPVLPFYLFGLSSWIKRKKREELALILPWIFVPLIVFSFYWFHSIRFIIFILPALLILSGYGFYKMWDIFPVKNKIAKNVLNIKLIALMLIPTALFQFDIIQRRAAGDAGLKKTFEWIKEHSAEDDIILSFPYPALEYYSQRKIFPLELQHEELRRQISKPKNVYLVLRESWEDHKFRRYMFEKKQWLDDTYGLILLRTIDTKLPLSLLSKFFYAVINKAGIYTSQASIYSSSATMDRWEVYLISKRESP